MQASRVGPCRCRRPLLGGVHQFHRRAVPAPRLRPAWSCTNSTPPVRMWRCRSLAVPSTAGGRLPNRVGRADREARCRGTAPPGHALRRLRGGCINEAQLLEDADLKRLDPDLDSVVNVNEPDDYTASAGTRAARDRRGVLRRARGGGRRGVRTVRARPSAPRGRRRRSPSIRTSCAALNGDQITRDEQFRCRRRHRSHSSRPTRGLSGGYSAGMAPGGYFGGPSWWTSTARPRHAAPTRRPGAAGLPRRVGLGTWLMHRWRRRGGSPRPGGAAGVRRSHRWSARR
jgi:hypothetical protein